MQTKKKKDLCLEGLGQLIVANLPWPAHHCQLTSPTMPNCHKTTPHGQLTVRATCHRQRESQAGGWASGQSAEYIGVVSREAAMARGFPFSQPPLAQLWLWAWCTSADAAIMDQLQMPLLHWVPNCCEVATILAAGGMKMGKPWLLPPPSCPPYPPHPCPLPLW